MTKAENAIERNEHGGFGILGRLRGSVRLCNEWRRFRKDEDGSMIIFTLFIFVLMLLVGGMAVDLMRFETKRAALQNTLDAATLTATNMRSTADPTTLVNDFMSKRGYDPNLVNVTVDEVRTGADPANGNPGTLAARSVQATYDLDMNTIFMHMMGINTLGTGAIGAAQEGVQSVEISLVVDTSGSMSGTKISALKTSAKSFIQAVVDEQRQTAVTSVSIIPYNTTIVVPDSLLSRLNTNDVIDIPPIDQAPYPGAAVNYMRTSYTSASSTQGSKCVRFYDSEMLVSDLEENVDLNVNPNPNYMLMRRITPTQELDMMAYYDQGDKSYGSGGAHSPPGDDYNRRCDPTRAEILPFGTTIQALEDHIDTLDASGWTAVDHGLKWGVALLDPAMRPIVNNMISNNLLPTTMQDRPHEYDPAATLKVLVLMTDGANTNQYDLRPEYKNGPSRIWYSEMAANDTGPAGENWINDFIVDSNENGTRDRAKSWYDGYFVEMPANNAGQRWLRQHKPWDNDDGVMYAESELPADAVQMTYTELYDRFSENALANFFRDTDKPTDYTAYNDHRDAEIQVENEASADRRMNGPADESEFGMCDVAKVNNDILVYTIAFQAGSHAEAVMRECASGVNGSGFFFDADNSSDLNDAFAAIAGSITKLRLTQ